jgi:hypothetical protein
MAHDAVLAQRLRALLREEPGVSEKAILGGLLLRVEPEQAEELLDGSSVDLFEMRGRRLRGWLHVAADVVADDESLEEWVDRGVRHARSLPTEDASRPRRG